MNNNNNMTLREAMAQVGEDDARYYEYLVIKECDCGEFETISSIDLSWYEHEGIDLDMPVSYIDDDHFYIYVQEKYICKKCSYVYEFPQEIKKYKSFFELVCKALEIEEPTVYVVDKLYTSILADAVHSPVSITSSRIRFSTMCLNYRPSRMANVIIHELRHSWQHIKAKDIFDRISEADIPYLDRPTEKDAYGFADDFECIFMEAYMGLISIEELMEEIKAYGICTRKVNRLRVRDIHIVEAFNALF